MNTHPPPGTTSPPPLPSATHLALRDSLLTAHLSLHPLEPVLVFKTDFDAERFRALCGLARVADPARPHTLFLPLPPGLLRVRTAQRGDVAFDFAAPQQAAAWHAAIRFVGLVHAAVPSRKEFDRTVYLGKILRP